MICGVVAVGESRLTIVVVDEHCVVRNCTMGDSCFAEGCRR